MSTQRIWAISYLLLVFALVSLAVYTRGVDQAWRECIPPVVKQNTESNAAARAAADRKDRAELRRLAANRHLVSGYAGGVPATAEDVRKAAQDYIAASLVTEAELRRTIATRQANPLPDFEDVCHANDD